MQINFWDISGFIVKVMHFQPTPDIYYKDRFAGAKKSKHTTQAVAIEIQCPRRGSHKFFSFWTPFNKRGSFRDIISTCPCYSHLNIKSDKLFTLEIDDHKLFDKGQHFD